MDLFRRKQQKPPMSKAQEYAEALGASVSAPVNKIHAAPTQHHLLDSLVTRPSGLVAVLESLSQCSQLIPPGALGNPTPVEVPVSGHNLVLTLINRSDRSISISGVRAVYTSAVEYDFPAQLCATPPGPMLVYTEDLRRPAENAVDGYQRLQKPHLEVHLGGFRPLIVEALLPDGDRAREPASLTVASNQTSRIVFSPVTHLPECIGWRLVIRWQEDGSELYAAWDLHATGFVGWTVTAANGEARVRPVSELGHWDPRALWQDGYTSYDEHLTTSSQPDPAWLDAVRD
jgi:hypothetical protein